MALFKINRGNETNLPETLHDGWAYFCTDTGSLYIDYLGEDGTTLYRKLVDKEELESLQEQLNAINSGVVKITSQELTDSEKEQVRANINAISQSDLDTVESNLNTHINNSSNPHNVTAAQIGAMEKVNPTGTGSFSLNRAADTTIGDYSFAEGSNNTASGIAAHAEGANTTVSNDYSHAEGYGVVVEGTYAHGEGADTRARGAFSHAQNHYAEANGAYSHAEGTHTIAQGSAQHVQGQWNIADSTSAHIVGNGTAEDARSNAYTLDWDGNAEFAGDIVADGCNSTEFPISLRDVNTRTASLEIAIADINSGIKVYAQDDEPTAPKEGDIWIDTDEAVIPNGDEVSY